MSITQRPFRTTNTSDVPTRLRGMLRWTCRGISLPCDAITQTAEEFDEGLCGVACGLAGFLVDLDDQEGAETSDRPDGAAQDRHLGPLDVDLHDVEPGQSRLPGEVVEALHLNGLD